MALIEWTLDGKRDKVQIAINRIKTMEPISNGFMDKPYYVAYSGGKDSDVLRILFELSGVPYELWHNHTTIDAPETVYYVRSIPKINISYPKLSMWQLIVKNGVPPTRIMRYCCSELKERNGRDRFIATGVRWAESVNRKKNRNSLELLMSKQKDNIILNADNNEDRRLFETCIKKGKKILNPIIDWTDEEVWEFLNYYGCKSNPLYERGFKRVGCVGCPMTREKLRRWEFELYPKYKAAYIRTFDRMINRRLEIGKPCHTWQTGREVFDWWIADVGAGKPTVMDGQISVWDIAGASV